MTVPAPGSFEITPELLQAAAALIQARQQHGPDLTPAQIASVFQAQQEPQQSRTELNLDERPCSTHPDAITIASTATSRSLTPARTSQANDAPAPNTPATSTGAAHKSLDDFANQVPLELTQYHLPGPSPFSTLSSSPSAPNENFGHHAAYAETAHGTSPSSTKSLSAAQRRAYKGAGVLQVAKAARFVFDPHNNVRDRFNAVVLHSPQLRQLGLSITLLDSWIDNDGLSNLKATASSAVHTRLLANADALVHFNQVVAPVMGKHVNPLHNMVLNNICFRRDLSATAKDTSDDGQDGDSAESSDQGADRPLVTDEPDHVDEDMPDSKLEVSPLFFALVRDVICIGGKPLANTIAELVHIAETGKLPGKNFDSTRITARWDRVVATLLTVCLHPLASKAKGSGFQAIAFTDLHKFNCRNTYEAVCAFLAALSDVKRDMLRLGLEMAVSSPKVGASSVRG
ncbi:hypothetical protein BCR44DRAFT_43883 [Catenaria anguillulae PL171]|uniref:Uncharacterized protein n=1 Tax=Catenaria anguillulae PL171 TaxID=765915 RepID=A0A1Y2I7H7_9FUNG|nr:hypothetical protein BCR44DRAFT_43883 [Catenaria anguillulae PL171]